MDGPFDDYKSPSDPSRAEPNRWPSRDEETFPPRPIDSYRRRSPVSQDRRQRSARGRSRSPVAIDRYQPTDRGNDRGSRDDFYATSREYASRDREDRRRAPSPIAPNIDRYVPGQDAGKLQNTQVNPVINPLNLDYQVGFNYFAEWWRHDRTIKEEKERAKHGGRRPSDRVKGDKEAREERDRERAQIQVAYDAYKAELQIKMARSFVQQHKGEEWFRERYLPEVRDPIRQRVMEFRRSAFQQWGDDLENGLFDDYTLEGIYKSESDGAGGVVEKEEGETTAVAEVLGVLDLLPTKGGDLRDESINQPALLIKTLAPNVSREKIEDFCKEHLGEDEGGFKWLSLSDPNPLKKCHRIGWIMLNPGPEPMAQIERGDGREEEGEDIDGGPAVNSHSGNSTSERALEAINEKTIKDEIRGDFICHVGVHVPPSMPRKKALWDLFSAPERIERDLTLARRIVEKLDSEIGIDADAFSRIDAKVEDLQGKGWLQPPVTALSKSKKTFDTDADMVLLDDGEAEEGEEEEGAIDDDEVDDEDIIVKKKKLDLAVEYLRRVYNFCFFCVFESDSIHELVRKCPGGHLRRPRAGLSSAAKAAAKASAYGEPFPTKKKESFDEAEDSISPVEEKKNQRFNKNDQQLLRAFNWVKTYEDKLLQLLEPENVDIKRLGGKPENEALDEELAKFIKQEDENKFRCKVPECSKLFKADHFWRKHVEKRHEEWLTSIKKDLNLVNTYVLDPSHIAPSRSDANSNGHFPLPNNHNLPTGTPRGFNLSHMQFGGFNPFTQGVNGMSPGGMGTPGFPGFMAQHAIQTQPGGWMGNGMPGPDANGMMGMHQPGAMRRGNQRNSNNRSGPYDRRGNNPRYSNNPSQGGPMGMNMGMGMGITGPPGRMMSGPVGTGMGGFGGQAGGNRWGDGVAPSGGAMVGPREAVQGRQLKSYEDLDAMSGDGAGELNY